MNTYRYLTIDEREKIMIFHALGHTITTTAVALKRHKSTISIYYNIGSNIDVIVEEKKNKLIEQELEFIDNDDKDYYYRKAFISVILAILTLLFLFFVLDNFGNFK
ncbi:helix-turn-helix domain-containing protein [Gallibacterium anatis]|uniref:Helix-turn-helix domain-containing protein n=3 Tax=Gallibacterium anatis TaxID=750 RepID=A0A930Y4M4_9PAST|nr:helix-turn-helix domain-containing protein [Gallibacterium anatis]ERF77789.1 hypothetical protein N561_09655 [Gallibacterium anatis 12656/12]KGQ47014.1 hypothetical protein JL04_11935 [Gallibacterium anatis]KGQ61794.1 hypothetical protein IO48_06590 [Gallibacterium anatis 4895]MBF4102110.1 helix-turn-helix domain-containing protein [Gallibacterium anatis]HJF73563.1 helix-turn-helix domain-containing protein [Gallibacterium anatis]